MRNTKKFVAALLCAIVLISSVPFSAFADNTAGTVTGSYVYIRSGPGTGYSVLGGCLKGSSVLVTGEENGWYKISYNGIEGYMTASYVERSGSAAFGTVTGSVVNLRKSATTSSSIVAIPFKEPMEVNIDLIWSKKQKLLKQKVVHHQMQKAVETISVSNRKFRI